MAQDVAELTPRVRRAVEGPVPLTTGALTDDQLLALSADAIADIILFTNGRWEHTLLVTHRDNSSNVPDQWAIDPELKPEEEGLVAAQVALTFFFHELKDKKVSEHIINEGQEWQYSLSSTLLRDWFQALKDQRDAALAGAVAATPVLARYASILEVRDKLASAVLEPWVRGGLGGGIELCP